MTPGDVAANDCDEELTRAFAALFLDDDSGAQRKGERHDEAEQDLAQARRRIEIAVHQRSVAFRVHLRAAQNRAAVRS